MFVGVVVVVVIVAFFPIFLQRNTVYGGGIQSSRPGQSMAGQPMQKIEYELRIHRHTLAHIRICVHAVLVYSGNEHHVIQRIGTNLSIYLVRFFLALG